MRIVSRYSPLLVVALCVAALLSACGSKEKTPEAPQLEVGVAEIRRQDVNLSSEFVGRTAGSIDAEVRARVEGVLEKIHFQDGGEVSEGQLLYSVEEAPLRAKVAEARAVLSEALTRQSQADSDLKRIRPLADINAVSKRELDAAIARKGVTDGGVDAAKAQVEAAEIQLGYAQITSPTQGLIGISKVKVGELVGRAPSTVVLNTVSKIDPIHVKFSVSEREYLYFAKLIEAQGPHREKRSLELVLADGSVHGHRGQLVSVDRNIDSQTGSINVEAEFPNPTKLLRPGLFAKIRTIAETRKDALVVPKRALKEMQGKYQVFVVAVDGSVESRGIELGADAGDSRVVESGLSEHERVAIDGIQRLRAGMVVKPKAVS